jgi:phage protein D
LRLPKNTKWKDEQSVPVKRGDKITVALGYDGQNEEVFTGYVKTVGAKAPIEISCEDEMFTLKNTDCKKKSYANANLKTMLKEQLPAGMKCEVFAKHSFGKYVVNTDTVAKLLGNLAEVGIVSYFKGDTLYCGMIHEHRETAGKKQRFFEGENGNIIESGDLTQGDEKDIKLKVTGKGTDRKGKKITVTEGDKDGEQRTFYRYNTTKEELKAEAKKKVKEFKVSGLSGSFKTFGTKMVWPLENVSVKTLETELASYKCTRNTITYNESGYRQNIEIGGKEL